MPEAHTDYIISVISEEFGVVAIILILLLFLIFIYMVFKKINYEKSEKIKLVLIGSITLILMQATIHVGVNIRLFPTTGMTFAIFKLWWLFNCKHFNIIWYNFEFNKKKNNPLKMKKKILISTGGSGGHVIPAITICDHLKNEYDVVISTDLRGFKYLDSNNHKIFQVNTPRLNRSVLIPFAILKVFFLTLKSLFILKREKIYILISTGGYMSLPLCLAAKMLKIKIFLLEPNMIIGRANKFFLNFL